MTLLYINIVTNDAIIIIVTVCDDYIRQPQSNIVNNQAYIKKRHSDVEYDTVTRATDPYTYTT